MPQSSVGDRFGPFTLVRALSEQGLRERWIARWSEAPERPPLLLELLPGPLAEHRGLPRPIREELAHLRVFGHRRFTTPGRLALEATRIGFSFEVPGIFTLEEVLDRLRRQHTPMPAAPAVELGRKLAEALVALHARTPLPGQSGAHHALRPAHIFLAPDGEISISATWVGPLEHLWPWGPPPGSWAYLAPEEVRGQKGDARSDLYAVGRMLMECLRLRPASGPEGALTVRHLHKESDLPELKDFEGHPGITHLLEKLLAHQPSARFANAEALLTTLTEVQQQVGFSPTLSMFLASQGWNDDAVSNTREIQRKSLMLDRTGEVATSGVTLQPGRAISGSPVLPRVNPRDLATTNEDPFASLEAALSDLALAEDTFDLVVEHEDGPEPLVEPLDDEDEPLIAVSRPRPPARPNLEVGDADLAAMAIDLEQILPEVSVRQVEPPSPTHKALAWVERIAKDGSRTRYPLDGTPVTVGRSPSCTIHLTGDGRVSRLHCRILHERGQFLVEDAGSNNGTLVDGTFIKKHILRGGEEIIVGGTMLQYIPLPADKSGGR